MASGILRIGLKNISRGKGHARKSKKEFCQFINISLGSLAETEYLFNFSKRLGYHTDSTETENLLNEVGKVLWSFYRSLAF